MPRIELLSREEPLGMDPERLATLYLELGEDTANETLQNAMYELTATLDSVSCEIATKADLKSMHTKIKSIATIAEPLGLVGLIAVAANATDAIGGGDAVAIRATLHRLERVANQSLKMVWDIQDLSG